jgi:calpain-15
VNSAGIYLVTLFVNGKITPVIVDDWFPVDDAGDEAAFCSSESGEIWGMLLEKAWAKLHGSFQRIESGECYHALQHMTGMPAKTYNHSKEDKGKFFQLLKKLDDNHCTMMASSITGQDSDKVNGIAKGHAYTIISAHEVTDAYGRQVHLLKMRNPWGSGEWTGAWSDKDTTNWTPALKQQLCLTNADDGIFFISYDDYMNYYVQTTVAFTVAEHLFYNDSTYTNEETAFYQFELAEDQSLLSVTVNQMGDRLGKYVPEGKYDSFKPSRFSMILINEQGSIVAHARQTKAWNFYQDLLPRRNIMTAGKYTLVIDVIWDASAALDPAYK